MGITAADWESFVGLNVNVACELGFSETEDKEVMSFLQSLNDDIANAK